MKFMIVNTDYSTFLRWLYDTHEGLADENYEKQFRQRCDTLFGMSDFYSRNLRKLGHEAWDILANNLYLQSAWKRDFSDSRRRFLDRLTGRVRSWRKTEQARIYELLAAQIKYYRPDVLLNHDPHVIGSTFLREMKRYVKVMVIQHAATSLDTIRDFSCYDLALSSFPPTVDLFKQKGLRSYLFKLGFESSILTEVLPGEKSCEITFVGNFFKGIHDSRAKLIEYLCLKFDEIKIWGPSIEQFSEHSPIRKHYCGPAWGRQLYELISQSKIVLNHHGDIPPYANNMRLYETTGMGTLLVTDWKENLGEMFDPGKEVVAYKSLEECEELIRYYLKHSSERKAIAEAGQRRTLKDHSYFQRMQEFVNLIQNSVMS